MVYTGLIDEEITGTESSLLMETQLVQNLERLEVEQFNSVSTVVSDITWNDDWSDVAKMTSTLLGRKHWLH